MIAKLEAFEDGRFWFDIPAAEAAEKYPTGIPSKNAPLNEMNEPCPWPWEPEQLRGAPLGQYHCGYCGGMQIAGMRHFDAREIFESADC